MLLFIPVEDCLDLLMYPRRFFQLLTLIVDGLEQLVHLVLALLQLACELPLELLHARLQLPLVGLPLEEGLLAGDEQSIQLPILLPQLIQPLHLLQVVDLHIHTAVLRDPQLRHHPLSLPPFLLQLRSEGDVLIREGGDLPIEVYEQPLPLLLRRVGGEVVGAVLTGGAFLLLHETEVLVVETQLLLVPDVVAVVHLPLAGKLRPVCFLQPVAVAPAALAPLAAAVLVGVKWEIELLWLLLLDSTDAVCVGLLGVAQRLLEDGVASLIEPVDDVLDGTALS
jgi:hypothetical protein